MTLAEFIAARIDEDEATADLRPLCDRARWLREVAAKRAILASWQEHERCLDRGYAELTRGGQLALIGAIRAIAAVWSDHPDYQQEWKP